MYPKIFRSILNIPKEILRRITKRVKEKISDDYNEWVIYATFRIYEAINPRFVATELLIFYILCSFKSKSKSSETKELFGMSTICKEYVESFQNCLSLANLSSLQLLYSCSQLISSLIEYCFKKGLDECQNNEDERKSCEHVLSRIRTNPLKDPYSIRDGSRDEKVLTFNKLTKTKEYAQFINEGFYSNISSKRDRASTLLQDSKRLESKLSCFGELLPIN